MTTLVASLVLLLLAPADDKPKPKIPIGKDTTIVMGPLDNDGYIDYETALNQRLGKGITSKTNAVVLLYKAFGPAPEGGNGMPDEFFKQLGIPRPPDKGDYWIHLGRHLTENLKLPQNEKNDVFEQHSWVSQRPWAVEEAPHIAAWLFINEKPLALVIEATKRPDYFSPMTSRRDEKGHSSLISCLVPGVQKSREIASALIARAMLRIKDGKYDEAWQDLLACHRLARLTSRGATLIESLVGIAIEQIASQGELVYLEHAKLTVKQVRDRLKDLQALPPMPLLADKIDLCERFSFLDCIQLVRRGGPGIVEMLAGGPMLKNIDENAMAAIDWTPTFRIGNRLYDRLASIMRLKDRAEREKQLDKIEEDVKALKTDALDPEKIAKLLMAGAQPDKTMGKSIGNLMALQLMPGTRKIQNAYDRCEQVRQNQLVAFALAAYRIDNDRYPAKLDDLAPKYLAAIPGDLFSGKPLIYRPAKDGYLFYSVGVNGKDEDGRWYNDDPPGDDPRVRMPLPEVKRKN